MAYEDFDNDGDDEFIMSSGIFEEGSTNDRLYITYISVNSALSPCAV